MSSTTTTTTSDGTNVVVLRRTVVRQEYFDYSWLLLALVGAALIARGLLHVF
jgi:hypothetical protein